MDSKGSKTSLHEQESESDQTAQVNTLANPHLHLTQISRDTFSLTTAHTLQFFVSFLGSVFLITDSC